MTIFEGNVKLTTYHTALEQDDAESITDEAVDFARYGLGSALVSGAVGLVNTAAAFSNMFGSEFERIEVDETLDTWGFKNASNYYQEHETLVDAVGLIASSIVPGAIGLKAAKAAQAGLSASNSTSKLTLGIRKALVPKNQAAAMRKSIAENSFTLDSRGALIAKASKEGFHQAAVEGVFIETAILAANNQNSALTNEDLSYFDSVMDNAGGVTFGVAFGGVIGGVAKTAINFSTLKTVANKQLLKEAETFNFGQFDSKSNRLGVIQGDRVADLVDKRDAIATKLGQMKDGKLEANNSLILDGTKKLKQLDKEVTDEIAILAEEMSDFGVIKNNITQEFKRTIDSVPADNKFNILAGLQRIGTPEDADILFNPKATPLSVLTDDEWIDVVQRKVYNKTYRAGDKTQRDYIATTFEDDITSLGYNSDDVLTNVSIRDSIFESGSPEDVSKLLRHELGRATSSRLRQLLDMDANAHVKRQFEDLARLNKPEGWSSSAAMKTRAKDLQVRLNAGASKEELEEITEQLEALNGTMVALSDPEELLANAWAVLSNPALQKEGEKLAPDVLKLMQNNIQIKQRLGLSEAFVDLRTGKMFNVADRTPTVRDLGNVKQKGNSIVWEGGATNISPKFNILDTTPRDASAHFFEAFKSASSGKFIAKNLQVEWTNFHQLNKVLHTLQSNTGYQGTVTVKLDNNITKTFSFSPDDSVSITQFTDYYKGLKKKAITELRNNPKNDFTDGDIARLVDTDEEFAFSSGYQGGETFWSTAYTPDRPTVTKLFYKNRKEIAEGDAIQGIQDSRIRIREAQMTANSSINDLLYDIDENLVDMLPASSVETGVNFARNITRADDAAGFAATNQGDFGTGKSWAQLVGQAHNNIKRKGNEAILLEIDAAEVAIKAKPEAIAEASALDSILRQKFYTFVPQVQEGGTLTDILASRVSIGNTVQAEKNIARLSSSTAGQGLAEALENTNNLWSVDVMDTIDEIVNATKYSQARINKLETLLQSDIQKINNPELANYWKANIKANQLIVKGKRVIAGNKGLETNLREDVLYPGNIDPDRYKFIKYVSAKKGLFRDDKPGIIGGPTAEILEQREAIVREKFGDAVEINTVDEINDFFKAQGTFDQKLSLNEWQTNASLHRKGVLWDVAPEPTPQLFDSYRKQLQGQWSRVTDNLVEMRYSEEVAALQAQSKLTELQKSTFHKELKKGNAFDAQIKIMLNKENRDSFGGWRSAQEGIDKALTKVYTTVKHSLVNARTKADYDTMNKYMDDYNLPKVYSDRTGEFLVKSEAVPEQAIRELMPKLNGAAATLMLRLDYIQPFINAISTPITAFPELKHLVNSVPKLRAQQAQIGLRTKLPTGAITVPEGQAVPEYSMFSNMKLAQQSIKDFFHKKDLAKEYYQRGYSSSIVREMRDMTDQLALDPSVLKEKGVAHYNTQLGKLTDFLAKPADFSEEFVKFVAARMADITLTNAGVLDSTVKNMAINTFVKRVHGNYTYAQRPALFQGVVGQAVGLFQTYQFNLFQQLLRHVGDKQTVAAASMLGLQAGIFGAQSVPGFRALNEHIGERSLEGNDFYTGAQEAVGDELSEWLLYGVASNFTKPIFGDGLELYTRGDLNPRTPFIIPTSIDEVPVYSLATKFVGSMLQAADSVAEGVPAGQVFAEALAQNGVNRPLSGIGQIISGARTTSKGTLLSSTQDLNFAQSAVRVLGTKTLDESIAIQSFYRGKGYESYRQEKTNQLGVNVKKLIRSGEWDEGQYNKFIRDYTKQGGKVDYFDRWLHSQALGATQSQIYGVAQKNDSPEGRYLQNIMGGQVENYVGVQY